jgi:protein O-mannosyl-transferase
MNESTAQPDAAPHTTPRPAGWRWVDGWPAAVLLGLIVVVTFSPVLVSTFSGWDDEDTLRYNEAFNPPSWATLAERWAGPHLRIYIPLTHTVWHGLALISPPPPAGQGYVVPLPFKLASLFTHALTSVLVWVLLRRLLQFRFVLTGHLGATHVSGRNDRVVHAGLTPGLAPGLAPGVAALVGAGVFALHPLQVESVGWTSGYKDLLFGLLGVCCILAYVGGEADRSRPRPARFALAAALLILAGLSKPTAMVLPPILLVLDVVCLRRPPKESIARLLPLAVIGLAFAVSARVMQSEGVAVGRVALVHRPLVVLESAGFYLSKWFVPTNLAFDYGRSPTRIIESASLGVPWTMALGAAGLLALGVVIFSTWRRVPLLAAGLLIAMIAVAPVSGLAHFDFAYYSTVADHYLYLHMLGIGLAIAALCGRCSVGRSKLCVAVCAIVLLAWTVLSFRQSLTWRDITATSTQSLKVNPRSFGSMANLGTVAARAGRDQEAEAFFRQALDIEPNDATIRHMLAATLQEQGRLSEAIAEQRRALALMPGSVRFRFGLAELLLIDGQIDEGQRLMEEVARLEPNHPRAARMAEQARDYARRLAATRATSRPASNPAVTP